MNSSPQKAMNIIFLCKSTSYKSLNKNFIFCKSNNYKSLNKNTRHTWLAVLLLVFSYKKSQQFQKTLIPPFKSQICITVQSYFIDQTKPKQCESARLERNMNKRRWRWNGRNLQKYLFEKQNRTCSLAPLTCFLTWKVVWGSHVLTLLINKR